MGAIGDAISDAAQTVGAAVSDAAEVVGSAVGSVAEGVAKTAEAGVDQLSGIGSVFGDVLETVGTSAEGLLGSAGGIIGDVANFLNPVDFFQNVGSLFGDLFSGPLGDIAGAITDPLFNFAEGIAGFAQDVFSGDLIRTLENVITDYPISRLPAEALQKTLGNTADAMNGVFETLVNLNPASPDFSSQLADLQQQIQQLGDSDTIIGQMLDNMNELTKRILPF